MDDVLTVDEAATRLGVTPETVRYRIRRGLLRGRRAGARLWLVDAADVARAAPCGRLTPGRKPKNISEKSPETP